MKIFTCLLAFASDGGNPCVLTDSGGNTPLWIYDGKSSETLDIVRDGLYNISGIGTNWFPTFNQAGWFELKGELYLLYSIYFPSTFELANQSYKWVSVGSLNEDDRLYNIIRHIYSTRRIF